MASLNLRDRVLETTIAYVGSSPDRRRQTLDALARGIGDRTEVASRAHGDGVITHVLDVRPTSLGKVNGCDLLVHVVVCEAEEPAQPTWVDGADGVVLLLGRSTEHRPLSTDSVASALSRIGERLKPNAPLDSLPIVVEVESATPESDGLPIPVVVAPEGDEGAILATFEAAMRRAIDAIRAPRRAPVRPAPRAMPLIRQESATPAFGVRRSRPAAASTPSAVAAPAPQLSRRPTEPLPPPIVGVPDEPHAPIALPLSSTEPARGDDGLASAELQALSRRIDAADAALEALRAHPPDTTDALRAVDLHAQSENLERAFARRLEPIARALVAVEERLAALERRLDASLRATG
jgi:hypothetical protein